MSVTKKPTDWETLVDVAAYLDRWAGSYIAEGFRRILYGTDEPCPEPDFYHWVTTQPRCGTCHGTGRIKTPGVVERVAGDVARPKSQSAWLSALRREIGEATP